MEKKSKQVGITRYIRNNDKLRLSVIIPTYEEPLETLSKTVNQFTNFPNIEVIISDSSINRIPGITDFQRNVKIVGSVKTNIAKGRNTGAEISSGDVLVFLDADVIIEDIDAMINEINNTFYYSPFNCMILKMKLYGSSLIDTINTMYCNMNMRWFHAGRGECIIVRKKDWNNVGGFDTSKNAGEDVHFTKSLRPIYYSELYYVESGRRIRKLSWTKMYIEWMKTHFNNAREWDTTGRD